MREDRNQMKTQRFFIKIISSYLPTLLGAASLAISSSSCSKPELLNASKLFKDTPPLVLSIPDFDYLPDPLVATVTNPITTPAVPAITIASGMAWSISPALPTGLKLDTATGIIAGDVSTGGVPTVISASQVYSVTLTYGGSTKVSHIIIAVNDFAPTSLIYPINPEPLTVNHAANPNTPSHLGGTPTLYVISPPLPAGMAIDSLTGIISGTPTALSPVTPYTVTATNSSGIPATTTVVISADLPPVFSYVTNPEITQLGIVSTPNNPVLVLYPTTGGGGAPTGFAVSPSLPSGLSMDPVTGVISGTPTAVTPAADYTVTATNSVGSASRTLNLTVNDAPPVFTYSTNPATYTKSAAITANSPIFSNTPPTAFTVNPALPTGLSFNTSTGVITGTPSVVSSTTTYTVTGTNANGSGTASVSITVNDTPPALTYSTNPATYTKGTAITANVPINTGGTPSSYSVLPALPAGLSFNTSDGKITGTPTAVTAAANYTVTATNSGGSATVPVNITVNDVAPVFTYTTNSPVYVKGTAITANSPINSGGAVISYGVSPALPAGLALNTSTGVISGTPTAVTALATYTVTATNSGGSATASVNITVKDIAPAFTYSTTPATYTTGSAITANTVNSTGGAIVSFSINPALPTGLGLNTSTGAITGTPTVVSPTASYTVTGTNSGGSATATVSITVNDSAPAFTYTTNPATYSKGTAITPNSPINTGGTVVSYAVSPALPAGLALNTSTGVVTGTPTAVTALATYTVTATNSGGSANVGLQITVTDIAPVLTYTTNPAIYTKSTAITANSPINTGGTVISYSVSPALPTGLSLSTSTGVISGTPTVVTAAADYTVTATNTGGFATVAVNITVKDVVPAFTYAVNPATYIKGTAITANTVTSTGGAITSFSVSPALPAGLSFNTSTGAITGTPTVVSATASYTVTGTNSGGSTNVGVSITVNDVAPALTYTTNPATYTKGTAITANSPINTGGTVVSYSVSPTLPSGLALNTSTGVITGTPSAVATAANYTVTATNSGGSANVAVNITVNDIAPVFTYTTNPAVYTKNTAISANSPINTGGTVVSYSVSPTLPAGLSLSTTTGVISGTPTAITATASYTVTANNSGGSATASVSITVNDVLGNYIYTYNPGVYTTGTPIINNDTSQLSGGAIVAYDSVTPSLPVGLSLNSTTGTISGTPVAVSASTTYTVGGHVFGGAANSTTISVTIVVNDVAPALTYTTNPATYVRGTAITANSPSNTGGTPTGYSINPALPAGLSFNTSTGVITGTPTAVAANATYTVTATNSGGSVNVGVQIQVNDTTPAFTYAVNPATYTKNSAIAADTVTSTGGTITSFSVSPALPTGLSLNTSTGTITGTPTAVTALATYTVTGSNSGGSANVGVQITVNDITPAFTYALNPATYTRGSIITANTVSSTGGAITSFSVSPALPAGLLLNTSTGTVSGTPTAVTASATYTVTGNNSGGSTNVGLQITIIDSVPALTYTTNPATYTVGSAITNNSPANTGGAPTGYSINPALPAGLSFNTSTGVISGTPTAVASNATYTVTATNSGGSANVGVQIQVNAVAPAFTYAVNPATYTKASSIAANTVTSTGGTIASFSVSPALPAGLALNTSTGAVTGTPTAVTALATYTVTATNSGGSANVGLQITIDDIVPAFTYASNPVTYTKGTAITSNTVTSTGGTITSFSVSPALPAGLSLNTSTGAVTGNPTTVTATATYTVTGSNSGGGTGVGLQITVIDTVPVLTYSTNPATYIVGTAITTNSPVNTGGAPTGYSINPALPAGLTFNTSTGTITGNPSSSAANATYTVTASNSGGSANVGVQIRVNDVAPAFTYASNPATYIKNSAISSNTVTSTGGTIVSFSVSPALPAGLSLNTSTGTITGTPTGVVATATYTVTGTNSGGTANVGLSITVNDIGPVFSYSANPATYSKNTAITANTVSSTGGAIVSFSVSPALPAGLSLNTSTGAVTGTPTVAAVLTTYTVTGTNSGGSANVGLQLTVSDLAPSLTYSDPNPIYTKDAVISPNDSPINSGGAVTSYAISPALPAGISFNTSTGVISGTPTALATVYTYTVTASNSGGSATAAVALTVNDALPAFTYAFTAPTYTRGTAIANNDPTSTGGAIISYSISPALSAGLSFNTSTGRISGTPTVIAGSIAYTINATNSGGTTPATVTIIVNDIPPTSLSYAFPTPTYTRGSSITTNTPTVTGGGPITSYTVSPALPAGLSISATTGLITGASTVVATPGSNYTITAANSGGSTTAVVNITVADAPPGSISYSSNPAVYNKTIAITSNTPTVSSGGGTIISYSITPTLPAGLSFDTNTGIISGTPTATATQANYTVTGNVSGGCGGSCGQAVVSITVNEQPPANLSYSQPTVVYPVDVAIISNIPTNTGGPIASYTVSPSLPSGMTINSSTGIISGTPSTTSVAINYTVTGTNTGGSTTKILNIRVSGLAPAISSIFPTGGDAGGGTPVTLTGNYFRSGATVTVGGVTCTSPVVVSGTQMTCNTGAHASGATNVVVTNPDLQTNTLTNGYMYSSKVWLGGAAQSANAWATSGNPITGSGDGMLSSTLGNYAGTDGYLYIVDTNGHRVAKFDSTTGSFVGWLGGVNLSPTGGLSTCTSTGNGGATPGWCTGGTSQAGTGDSMFNTPVDTTLDTNGYLYVADYGNHRIQKFNATTGALVGWIGRIATTGGTCTGTVGTFTGGWCTGGTSQTGTGDGMFAYARAVHVDPLTNILYVADRDNNRVQKFNASTGAFLGWIGLVKTITSMTCASGTPAVGSFTPNWCSGGTADTSTSNMNGNGTMNSPRGLSVDSTYLYVMQTGGYRVDRYNMSTGAHGGWVGGIANKTGMTCLSGTTTNGVGTPSWCTGGTSQAGTTDGMIVTGGTSRGVFADPTGNNLFIGDYGGDRIQRFSLTTGVFTGWIGWVGTSPTSGDTGCAGAATGAMTPGWCKGGTASGGNGLGQINGAAVVTMDPNRVYLYVSDDVNARLDRYYLSSGLPAGFLGAVKNVAPSWIANGVPITGNGDGVLSNPFQSVTDGTYMYVSDTGNHRIVKFNQATGAYIGWIGNVNSQPSGGDSTCSGTTAGTFTPGWCIGGTAQLGTGAGMMSSPMGLAIYSGVLYVADSGNNRVSKYNTTTGAFLGWTGTTSAGAFNGGWATTGTPKTGTTTYTATDGRLTTPRAVAVDPSNTYLYVSDSGNSRIIRFNLSTGASPNWIGLITSITGISGCTGAANSGFTPTWCTGGTSKVGTTTGDGGMNTPYGITTDSTGNILVADQGTHRINWYSSTGAFQGWMGRILANGGTCTAGAGNFTGGFCTGGTSQTGSTATDGVLKNPQGVAFDGTGAFIYVSDTGNNRVSKYRFSTGQYGAFYGWQGNIGTSPTGGDSGCSGALAGTATLGWCTGGTPSVGNGNGMFSAPAGLFTDSSHLFIGDYSNYRIMRMDQ